MFEGLVGHPEMKCYERDSEKDLVFIQENLSVLAPDFVEFIEKFGRVEIGDGYWHIHSWVYDMADWIVTLGLEKPNVDAWLFGDGDGDMSGIDKKTGEIIEFMHESQDFEKTGMKFAEYIRHLLR